MNKKIMTILQGAGLIVLGILLACFGGQAVLDTYFGIIFLITGIALCAFCVLALIKTKSLLFGFLFGAVAFTLLGIFLLAKKYTFNYFVYTIIILIIAGGIALTLYGIYTIAKFSLFYGIGQIVVGAVAAVLGFLYIFNADFYKVFWIIVGVLVALYGLFYLIGAFVGKKEEPEAAK